MTPTTTMWRLRNLMPLIMVFCCLVVFFSLSLPSIALAGSTPTKDKCGYPDNSNLPRSGVLFNESEVLRAFSPVNGGTTRIGLGLQVRMWYNDEHALTLGVNKVIVQNSSGATISTTPYTIETPPTTSAGGSASNPAGINVGS